MYFNFGKQIMYMAELKVPLTGAQQLGGEID